MDLPDGVSLLGAGETTHNGGSRNGKKGARNRLEEFLGNLREPGTVISLCYNCKRPLSDGLVPLSVSRELFAKHLEEDHPEKKPRDIEVIRAEHNRRRKEEKARKEKERRVREKKARAAPQGVVPTASESGKTSPGSKTKRSRKRIRQPGLTDEMVTEMRRLYLELGRIKPVCSACYKRFGFSSPYTLEVALSEHKIILGIPQNRRRISDEVIEAIKRLHTEEGLPIREITNCYYANCGYSFTGFRNAVREILIENGLDPRKNIKNIKRAGGNRHKMTPAQIDVAWQLYSVGNYSIPEIQKLNHKLWGISKNCVVDSLKRAGHRLRADRWDNDGSRPISKEEAIEMIKAVA